MSSNLSTVIQSITNTSRLVRTLLPVIRPYIMGNPPKITKWRVMDISEANHQEGLRTGGKSK